MAMLVLIGLLLQTAAGAGADALQRLELFRAQQKAVEAQLELERLRLTRGLPAPSVFERMLPGEVYLVSGDPVPVLLGCVTCSKVAPDSTQNPVSIYGSDVSPWSIHNPSGAYGDRLSPTSACNSLATHPPTLMDKAGTVYGRLTRNPVLQTGVLYPGLLVQVRQVCEPPADK